MTGGWGWTNISTMAVTVDPALVESARASFERCCRSKDFLPSFYSNFFARCPVIKPMFERTDFTRQHRLLQHALGLLLAFPQQSDTELLRRVADRHSQNDLDVDPKHYECFVDSLIETVRSIDHQFSAEVESAWRTVVAPGIAFMKGRYEKRPSQA